ncbi:hypothetical protein ACQP1V_16170 [Microtetraspora malaysiensis]|uniref:hypothetical protein n=1 Tax=Microtetraspora malaysiensis TaxID=161358 RepID=UPI003D8DBF19
MRRPDGHRAARRSPAVVAAERLREELERYGIGADIHEGDGVALVSVWVDLVVWTDGAYSYLWWTGEHFPRSSLRKYTYGPVDDPVAAARRVAARYAELRHGHPRSREVGETLAAVPEGFAVPSTARRGCWYCERPSGADTALEEYRVRVAREPLCAWCRILSDLRRQLVRLEPLLPEVAEVHPDLVAEAWELLAPVVPRSGLVLHGAFQVPAPA